MCASPQEFHEFDLRQVLDVLPDALFILDKEGRFTFVNEAFARLANQPKNQLLKLRIWDVLPPSEATPLAELTQRITQTGGSVTTEVLGTISGRCFEVHVSQYGHDVVVHLRDITDRKRADANALELEVQHAALRAEADALQAFAAFTEATGSITDQQALAQQAVQLLHQALHDTNVTYFELHSARWQARHLAGEFPAGVPELLKRGLSPDAPVALLSAEATEPVFLEHWQDMEDEIARELPYYAAVAVTPVRVQGSLQGLLAVGHPQEVEWDSRSRLIIRAVWQSLNLVAERAANAQRLAAKREALEAANAELDAFAHSVSHDLRAPIRHIQGFTGLLRRSLSKGDMDGAERYLQVIDSATGRMNALIDDLLQFSKFSEQPLQRQAVNLNELILEVRSALEPEASDRLVEWRLGPLPIIWGDVSLLRQVFLNFLGNAVKYTSQRERAIIEVFYEHQPGTHVIHVRDNGAGFDPRYQDRLFGVFQRLHRQEEFPGTGVGLATVKRIIRRHNGNVWATGEVGKGATFSFSLPERRS